MSESEVNKILIQNTRFRALLKEVRKQLCRAQRARLQDAESAELLRDRIDDAIKEGNGQ